MDQISQPFTAPVASLPLPSSLALEWVSLPLFAIWLCGFAASTIAWLQWWQAWSFNPGKDRCQRLSLRASRDQLKIGPQISPVPGSATRKALPIGFRIVVHEREK